MKIDEYMVTKLAEEAAECIIELAQLIQRCTKIQTFGLDEVQKGQLLSNMERLKAEVNDFYGTIERMEQLGFPKFRDEEMIAAKLAKLTKYAAYSAEKGTLHS